MVISPQCGLFADRIMSKWSSGTREPERDREAQVESLDRRESESGRSRDERARVSLSRWRRSSRFMRKTTAIITKTAWEINGKGWTDSAVGSTRHTYR